MRQFAQSGNKKSVSRYHFPIDQRCRRGYCGVVTRMSPTTVHVKLAADLKAKLDEMAKSDRREKTDFIRLLIEDEWNRRTKHAPAEDRKAADEVRA